MASAEVTGCAGVGRLIVDDKSDYGFPIEDEPRCVTVVDADGVFVATIVIPAWGLKYLAQHMGPAGG